MGQRHTQGLIKKMIEKPLDEKARLVLFNTLYFKSTWRDPFIHEMTYNQTFTTTEGATSLDIEQPVNVTFDQPFLYMIMDMDNQIPLFIGIIDNPDA